VAGIDRNQWPLSIGIGGRLRPEYPCKPTGTAYWPNYDYRISTGPLEGTNNKIKTMKRQAYGYRDNEFLKLKIMAIHLTKYALVG
jgi:hypothetical protein